ncbi:MAG: bifunctional ornithine acetyltransferase/N-acetylglutamate synthase [Oscillospiraceae bacterium]|jgi:glutamate N-acetyltransferase/amino-acid N-acetyltransferase|nr:bifunctional ornithine acetyltransferase/N-acetylglutamate synthase [Oscillospiraceae bacterium]
MQATEIKFIDGGICAPLGFSAGGLHCGVKTKNPDKKDVAIIASSVPCRAAGVFTKNVVVSDAVLLTKKRLEGGALQAVIVNSGNANVCAEGGYAAAEREARAAAEALGLPETYVAVASTGVIGQKLNIEAIEAGVPALAGLLEHSAQGSDGAAAAIMTTDTVKKEYAIEVSLGGKAVRIGGIAKGSGMIHPNMGTMLSFITTDAAISQTALKQALRRAADYSFNRISVDGDTSTNDTCLTLANGLAENAEIAENTPEYALFEEALTALCRRLAIDMAADGEGATHLITCRISGANCEEDAVVLAKSVISSSLLKAAIFGRDANWGRILCAMGYAGVKFNVGEVSVDFSSAAGVISVCKNGCGLDFDEELAKTILSEHDIVIEIAAGSGMGSAECWGCDLTYDYVKINGDYRS